MIGFELLFQTISGDLKSKNDLLIAVIHLQCIQKGFLCVGTGEEVLNQLILYEFHRKLTSSSPKMTKQVPNYCRMVGMNLQRHMSSDIITEKLVKSC